MGLAAASLILKNPRRDDITPVKTEALADTVTINPLNPNCATGQAK